MKKVIQLMIMYDIVENMIDDIKNIMKYEMNYKINNQMLDKVNGQMLV